MTLFGIKGDLRPTWQLLIKMNPCYYKAKWYQQKIPNVFMKATLNIMFYYVCAFSEMKLNETVYWFKIFVSL